MYFLYIFFWKILKFFENFRKIFFQTLFSKNRAKNFVVFKKNLEKSWVLFSTKKIFQKKTFQRLKKRALWFSCWEPPTHFSAFQGPNYRQKCLYCVKRRSHYQFYLTDLSDGNIVNISVFRSHTMIYLTNFIQRKMSLS